MALQEKTMGKGPWPSYAMGLVLTLLVKLIAAYFVLQRVVEIIALVLAI